jgi:hypothetical protein
MIFEPVKRFQSITGSNTSGLASCSLTFHSSSLSKVMCSLWPQCAHSLSISTANLSLRKRPCTKGVANASSAQAANKLSPLLKLKRWGVLSNVTGKAQLTSPALFRTRKNRFFCKSSRIAITLVSGRCNPREMSSGLKGLPLLRGSSRTTKFLTC